MEVSPGGHMLELYCAAIENWSCQSLPDEKWRYTDKCGHEHRWMLRQGAGVYEVTSARWVVDMPETDEYPEYGHYECAECGEEIDPGMKGPNPYPTYTQGPKHYIVDGREVSPDEFERVRQEIKAARAEK